MVYFKNTSCVCADVSFTWVGLLSMLYFKYTSFLCANVSSTMVGLWSVLRFKYVSFVCALMCLPHGLVCDLCYISSTCFVSVR